MSSNDKISAKEIIAACVVLALVGVGIFLGIGVFAGEAAQKEVIISDAGAKEANNVEAYIRLISIDPIKGDANVRIELIPHGNIVGEDHSLAEDVKIFVPSANGKTEIEFKKGKNLAPIEAVLSLYGGNAADYPFDHHKAYFYLYMDRVPGEKKEPGKPAPAAADGEDDHSNPASDKEPASNEIALDVSFFGSIPGYEITAEKGTETDVAYVEGDISIKRSNTVLAFSIFIGVLMWGLAIAVLFLVISLLLRGRKIEIAMFSFMAALLFAFYTVRGSQPNVPPIGTFFDFLFFFWAEALVAVCLLAAVFGWVFRTIKS